MPELCSYPRNEDHIRRLWRGSALGVSFDDFKKWYLEREKNRIENFKWPFKEKANETANH